MKKTLLSIALAFGFANAFAQDLTSKKGEPILPEANDWAISFEATPFLNYAGRFLSNAGATAPTASWFDSSAMAIMGKMFKDEKTAYRAMLRLGFNSVSAKNLKSDNTVTTVPTHPAATPMVEDKAKFSSRAIVLGAGMEKRRGKTRLQGFYGADAMIFLTGGKYTYEYGNAYSGTNTNPTRSTNAEFGGDFSSAPSNNDVGTYGTTGDWVTERKLGSTFGLGVRGFIGAEYFIFPKISIGAEYGWGLAFSSTGDDEVTTESWGASAGSTTEVLSSGGSSFGIDTDINKWWGNKGNLFLTLHF